MNPGKKAGVQSKKVLAAAGLATVALASAAYAQTAGNQYSVSGGTKTRGGTVAKPKAADLNFKFTLSDPAGNVPQVVKTYAIKVEGGKVNTSLIPGCKASAMDNAGTDDKCPKGSKVGSGKLTALIGKSGTAKADALSCSLPFGLYNSGGGKAALWIEAKPPACAVPVAQAVPATWTKSGTTAGLTFTVPDLLRHQVGLDLPVIDASADIGKIVKKRKGKSVGFLESTGCKDGKRDFSVTFTTEDGQSQTVDKTLSYC
ncbi:hypothetical protein DSM104299_03853 [Baekduia alba]|uniref:hypothetical protein n=1 Tax=Baekduia alba TaxID=2997333 RepID=UPI00234265AA|nr:hypothetical protein [Baekduia alba]WCB95111.1 hypothetical protein DSM104299_03853 [Baekduia alba]